MRRTRRQGGGRTGTVLVLAGIVGVLGVTFVAGVWTGRHWPVLAGKPGAAAPAESAPGRRGPGERPKQAEPLPALTFYQELTAPLTAPPPSPRPARPAAKPTEPRREREKAEGGEMEPATTLPPAVAAAPGPPGSFTVQVGAYNARGPADTLRGTLAAAGHDARVVEAETPAGMRYRVQVGSFPSREAARETATRLSAERSLPAFVTAR